MKPEKGLIERAGALSVVAATPESLDAEDDGGAALSAHLGLQAPLAWPPEHDDAETRDWMRTLILNHPDGAGWGSWYIVADDRPVGICGFKGPPTDAGEVEVGYSVIEPEQGRGYAVAAVALLIDRAFRDSRVRAVVAETLPHLTPSKRVLEKLDFRFEGSRHEPELGDVVRYRLPKP